MEEKIIIKVAYDKDGNTVVEVPNSEEAVIAVANHIQSNLQKKEIGPLEFIFSVVVHFLAMDLTGNFEKQFIKNIKETTPQYRDGYRMMRQQLTKPKN